EETLSSKTAHVPDAPRGSRAQGTWTQKTVQLPAGTKYVAFRHYNCTDAFRINIDDIEITATAKGRSVNGAREMLLLSITDAPELLRSGEAEIVLEAHDVWNDGSGYQIVLDADHTAFGQEIPAVGNFTNNCDVPADFFAPFEYTVPENADPSCSPTNMVVDGTATVKIPAGVYDYAIAAPQAGVRIWIAGGEKSRADDYNFEAGKKYHFLMQRVGTGDGSELTISEGGSSADYTYTVYRDGTKIKDGLTATTFSEENVAAGTHNYCVEVKYAAGVSPKECVDVTVPGGVLAPVTNLKAEKNGDDVVLKWTAPNGTTPNPNPGETALEEGFESGIPATWKTIDADGDGHNWTTTPPPGFNAFAGHESTTAVSSASFINGGIGALTPDNYLVTPELNLANGGTLTFWVCAQDAAYAAEHYAVYASSTGNEAANFTNALLEETLTAKTVVTAPEAIRGSRAQGTWYQKTVQLPAGTKYVAFRHFDCTDMFWLNLDDVKIAATTKRADLLSEGFESGIPATWKTIDADGDGHDWTTTPEPWGTSLPGHESSATVSSASFINGGIGALTPDNYLVTPELNLANGGTLTFWVCAQDAAYAAEHYAVYASSTGNEAANFTNALLEETLTAKTV
ncbi:DUF2436 domain-containing protein, partial [Porphyromonas loveana]|uniref:DUF2436 domain-containing protein n=1 Tax=Porphyromonas loveana TaxID=1884669 RepID=UPI000E30BE91